MKVLVIDDEPLIRDIYAEFLELLGHESDVAADGREGLGRFDPFVHQAVITDFLMPGLTGLEIAEAIRGAGHMTPIVLISGSAEQPDERRAGQARLRFLCKPVPFAQFKATLAEVVEQTEAVR
jgi:CheY-like chemotaxis protein